MRRDHWPRTIDEARAVQEQLAGKLRITPLRREPKFVAAVDAAFSESAVIAVVSLFSFPGLSPLEDRSALLHSAFPYVPGYLSFREGPAIMKAIEKLDTAPDLILVDGQGIAHPRGIGIASHLGVLLNIPTIGCAKSRLIGDYTEPADERGSMSDLFYRGKRVGIVLRTRSGVAPLFVSPGHLTDFDSSVRIVLQSLTRFRIPEPLRRADHLTKTLKIRGRA